METPRQSPPCVYVVDDDRGVRTSLVMLLNAEGITARPFAEPKDLLDGLDHLAAGIFLIDVRMQGLSGIELLAELRARDCFWPAAIMTLMLGSIAGSLAGLAVIALRRGDLHYTLPFGTFLAVGAALSAVLGEPLFQWMTGLT